MIQTTLEWIPVSQHLPEPGKTILLTDGFHIEMGSLDDRLDRWWLQRSETRNIAEWVVPDPKMTGQVTFTMWAYVTYPKKDTGPSRFHIIKQSGTIHPHVDREGVALPTVVHETVGDTAYPVGKRGLE